MGRALLQSVETALVVNTADIASALHRLFVNREDCYCVQRRDGGYIKVDAPLTIEVLHQHLRGELTVGAYQLGLDNTVKYLCFDFDPEHLPDTHKAVQRLLAVLFEKRKEANDVERPRVWPGAVLLEASRWPDPSYHVWVLFSIPVTAKVARWLGLRCLELAGLDPREVEVFPKQTELSKDRPYGNFVKLPLGKHQAVGKWSKLLKRETFEPLPNEALLNIWGVSFSEADIAKIMSFEEKRHVQTTLATPENFKHKHISAPCIEGLLCGVSEGYRNEAALRLSCFLLNFRGENPERAWIRLQNWNMRNKPPLSEAELRNVFASAQKHGYIFGCEDVLLQSFCDKNRCGIFLRLRKRFQRMMMRL
ncbi:MAG: primase C-terminal domain-containing protein [Candidatus Bathyarchaeota archaeon]|nr:primase C-terminal domain-containing protein [Candidatus Bathyarchaeota archaeon]